MIPNEKQIVLRAARRDEQAFAQLYTIYFNKIHDYIYYKIIRKDEAEDLTALVFLKAWEAIENYRWQGYPFSTWLFRIAHNQLIDYYRKHRETLPLDLVDLQEHGSDPHEFAERASIMAQIRGALNQLTRDQKRVLELRYFEGYSIGEISMMMGKAPDAIRALQHRALLVLQPRIRDGKEPLRKRKPMALPQTTPYPKTTFPAQSRPS